MATKKRQQRKPGPMMRIIASGLLEAYRLDAATLVAFILIGVSVYRKAPDLLWAYFGVVMLLAVWAVGKVQAKQQTKTD